MVDTRFFHKNSAMSLGELAVIAEAKLSNDAFASKMIQDVAEASDNGAVDVQFIGGKIIISFTQIFGVPKYIESITATIEKIKPAHIGFEFVYRTHSWRDLKAYTWEWAQAKTWAGIKEGNWGEVYRKF